MSSVDAPVMNHAIPTITTTQWSSKSDSKLFAVDNPATGEILCHVAGGDTQTIQEAVAASKRAFSSSKWVSPTERSLLLLKCADALEIRKKELAQLLCLENGKFQSSNFYIQYVQPDDHLSAGASGTSRNRGSSLLAFSHRSLQ